MEQFIGACRITWLSSEEQANVTIGNCTNECFPLIRQFIIDSQARRDPNQ